MEKETEKKQKLPAWILFLPSALFVLASLIPVMKGESLNVVFFAVGISWALLAVAMNKARKGEGDGQPKP